jgi:hypothetical protein
MNNNTTTQEPQGVQGNLQEFAVGERERIEKYRKEKMEEKGYAPFWKAIVGTNVVEFLPILPRPNNLYENRAVFRVLVDGAEWDYSVNVLSPLYRDIISNIANGKTKMSITRVGTTKTDTRYSVVVL